MPSKRLGWEAAGAAQRTPQIRRPSQKRSRERYELILVCTERLLAEHPPEAISIHMVAQAAGISPPSVYHFFPDVTRLYVALAEQYMQHFVELGATMPSEELRTWEDLDRAQFEVGRSFYNANPAAAKVMLGSALSLDTRIRDLEGLPLIAERAAELMNVLFVMPPIPDLIDRLVETIVLSDALWALSIYRHGRITEDMAARATKVRIAYGRGFMPARLQRRQPASPHPAHDPG